MPNCRSLFEHSNFLAELRAAPIAGSSEAINTPMMPMTMSTSNNDNPKDTVHLRTMELRLRLDGRLPVKRLISELRIMANAPAYQAD